MDNGKTTQLSVPQVFNESFETKDFKNSQSWSAQFNEAFSQICSQNFSSGQMLFKIIENQFNVRFASNQKHLAHDLLNSAEGASELTSALIMSLAWNKTQESPCLVLASKGHYYFLSSMGEIISLNSNRERVLSTPEKFDLFNDEEALQLNLFELIKHYYEEVCSLYIKNENYASLTKAQSYMIKMDPKDTKWFARRGLTLKRMGQYTQALSDLKRFLSFCPFENAPNSVKHALLELEGLNAIDNYSSFQMH